MEFIVWVETRLAGNTLAVRQVTKFDRRACDPVPEDIGLTLQEGKEILKQVQRNIVQTQIQVQGVAYGRCIHCRDAQLVKDIRTRQIRTVFGAITVACRRYFRCTCQGGPPSILWPLGPMRLSQSPRRRRHHPVSRRYGTISLVDPDSYAAPRQQEESGPPTKPRPTKGSLHVATISSQS